MTKQDAIQQEAIANLRGFLKRGDTLHVITKHISRSGMSRRVDVFHFYAEGDKIRAHWLTALVAKALGWRFDKATDTLRVDGCGMDMHFHTVYELAHALYGDGYALEKASL